MKFSYFLFIWLVVELNVGCDRPHSNPELSDPIYLDLEGQRKESMALTASAEIEVLEFQKNLAAAQPQTGQIKYAQKRLYEAEARLEKLRQRLKFLEMRVKTRLALARRSYSKAYAAKQPWPDPIEFEEYRAQKELEQAPTVWDPKGRREKSALPANNSQP